LVLSYADSIDVSPCGGGIVDAQREKEAKKRKPIQ
jgi:hypothetical protein